MFNYPNASSALISRGKDTGLFFLSSPQGFQNPWFNMSFDDFINRDT
jgi:hypothetical protein